MRDLEYYKNLALTDDLTQIPNRRSIIDSAKRDPGGAWVMIDLDGFKAFQDNNGGHIAGDRVLCDFSRWLTKNIRNSGPFSGREADILVARLHGDEFAVYVTGENPRFGARRIAVRVMCEWKYGSVTASAGVGDTLKEADRILYVVKNGLKFNEKN